MIQRGRVGRYGDALASEARVFLRRVSLAVGLKPSHELSLLFCDNSTICALNHRWRALDEPTDVLAFPQNDLRPGNMPPPGVVGDIVISLPCARTVAREMDIPATDHIRHLLIHGLLHLLGYDHKSPVGARRMRREENWLLAKTK